METRLQQRMLLVLIIFVLTLVLYRDFGHEGAVRHLAKQAASFAGLKEHKPPLATLEPANATLGVGKQQVPALTHTHADKSLHQFGAVIAVSRQQSPRRDGLLFAASITGIDISIPTQPVWTNQEISQLRADNVSTITRGSSLAWLGHLHALRTFLASEHSTALIIEDDVDWDIRLRTRQIPITASAFRSLTSNYNTNGLNVRDYWGSVASWDIRKSKSTWSDRA